MNKKNYPKKMINVFPYSSLPSIEKFLTLRMDGYKNSYFNEYIQILDSSISLFMEELLSQGSTTGKELQNFLTMLKQYDANSINLDEYLSWDDIRFYKNVFDVAKNNENKHMRDFASLITPPIDALMNMTFSILDLKNAKRNYFHNLSDEDKSFILQIRDLIKTNSEFSMNLKNKDFTAQNIRMETNKDKIEKLKMDYPDSVLFSNKTVVGYNPKEPIYLENEDGKIYSLDNHPKASLDWKNETNTMEVAYVLLPMLELSKHSEKEKQNILSKFSNENIFNPKMNTNVDLSLVKTENHIEDYFVI